MTIKNVVLVGATGTNGHAILSTLKSFPPNFTITILTRPESKAQQPDGHKIIRRAYDDPALVEELRGQDAIRHGYPCPIPLIDAAIKAGVKKFMPSECSSNTLLPSVHLNLPWYQQMKDVHDHLVKVSLSNTSFSFCALMTGPFLDFGLQSGMLGFDLKKPKATILDGGELQVSYTTLPQAALGVARALERDVSGYLKLSSVTCSQNELLAALEKVVGKKFDVKHETTQHYQELSKKLMKSHDPKGEEQMQGKNLRMLRIAFGADTEPGWGRGDNEMLGLEEGALEDLVKEALDKQ